MSRKDKEDKERGGKRSSGAMKPLRLWMMRLAVMVLIPAFFVGVLELGLRAVGAGHSTGFFIERTVDGERHLFTNHQFTFRFFPKALARSVIPHKIKAGKADDTYRIFVFGESAANGDPDPAYSFGRHLEILLKERFPRTNFEVVTTAVTAINSHVILPIARDVAGLEADLWIVYMGNNEMIGPYGASTVFGSKAPPLPLVRTSIAVKGTRIGQLMKAAAEGMKTDASSPQSWGGINMFTENLLHRDDPARQTVYQHFQDNLEDILDAAGKAGVPVLLSTVGANVRDCAPFASVHREGMDPAHLREWEALFEKGKELEEAESYGEALGFYKQAAALDAGFAELQYRMGRCFGLTGNLEAAREAVNKARDADALPVRADSVINDIIRKAGTGTEKQSIILVDTESLLAAESPGGMPGRELFYEHVHFTLEGNYAVARLFGERIVDLLPPETRGKDTGAWPDAGTCQRWLAATFWDRERLWTEMFQRQSSPPFDARAFNAYNLAYCEKNISQIRPRINGKFDRLVYESALEKQPEDYHLHRLFGNYLQLNNDLPGAITQFRWITDTFPDFEGGHQELGLALLLAGQKDAAKKSFERVLEINPHYGKARLALDMMANNPGALPGTP